MPRIRLLPSANPTACPLPPLLADHSERELVLLKLSVPSGPVRTEVLQMAQIFRGRVVDVSDTTLTLCVSGVNGKVSSLWSAGRGVPA